jgi:hypothetical protein
MDGLVHTATKQKLTGNPLPMSAINDED